MISTKLTREVISYLTQILPSSFIKIKKFLSLPQLKSCMFKFKTDLVK
jgi:hypothetical protein